jgi:hypothetical protein
MGANAARAQMAKITALNNLILNIPYLLRLPINCTLKTYGSLEPVAKPLVLQLAGGVKLLPTEVDFGVTSYESTNYSSIAEDGGRSGAAVRWGFAITSKINQLGA